MGMQMLYMGCSSDAEPAAVSALNFMLLHKRMYRKRYFCERL